MTQTPMNDPPLFVDLDGTIVAGDTLVISLLALARRAPWRLLWLPLHALRGRAAVKAQVSRIAVPDPKRLAYREDVLDHLRAEKARGRTLVLATAAHRRIADAVSDHLGLFDHTIASDDSRNVKGPAKLAAILELVPDGVFDYAGDSAADLPIFQRARESILVHPSPGLLKRVRETCRLVRVFA